MSSAIRPVVLLTSQPRVPAAAQQDEEQRATDQGREHADREVGVADHGAGRQIGAHQHQRATDQARRQQGGVTGASTSRMTCGTISPTNMMMPANATAAAVRIATRTIA